MNDKLREALEDIRGSVTDSAAKLRDIAANTLSAPAPDGGLRIRKKDDGFWLEINGEIGRAHV
jgi:hypothetical protein